MSALFNNGVKVLKDNATNIIGVVKQEVLSNVSPCRTHSRELTELVRFIINKSVENVDFNKMITNLKKVTTMCADDINKIIYEEVSRILKAAIVLDYILQKSVNNDDGVSYSFNEEKYYFSISYGNESNEEKLSQFLENLVLLHKEFIGQNIELYNKNYEVKIIKLAVSKLKHFSPIKRGGTDLFTDILEAEPDKLDKLYNEIINLSDNDKKTQQGEAAAEAEAEAEAEAADLRGGKRKTKAYSKKVAKKPVASQKKQSIYKEIFGKQMKIYKMPDSRKEYVKYKGDLHLITDYKSLIMKQKANAKPKPKK